MIKVVMSRDDYNFLMENVPSFRIEVLAEPALIAEREVIYLFDRDEDYDAFETGLNFTVVNDGMDNQDTVNRVGERIYSIYDGMEVIEYKI